MNFNSITATLEDYLEVILNIVSRHKVARSMEIADSLNVKRPTVTVALKALAEKGLINYEPRSFITLTKEGERIAKRVDRKHRVLHDIFVELFKLPEDESEKVACLMEHGMDTSVCKSLNALLNVVRKDKTLAKKLTVAIEHERQKIDCKKTCGNIDGSKERQNMETEVYDLNMLGSGKKGKILRILGTGNLKKRLGEMGITSGQEIIVIKAAPLDDPIEIKVRNYNLSLRREEAANILIESV